MDGNYEEGWPASLARWGAGHLAIRPRVFKGKLRWRGGSLAGRAILLHGDEGFEDTIQFARFAPTLAGMGASVSLQVQPGLERLLSSLPGVDRVVSTTDGLPNFDLHLPLWDVPGALGTTLETLRTPDSYLTVDSALRASWASRLALTTGLRVGLAWAGRPALFDSDATNLDGRRSLSLSALAPFGQVPGVSFVSLQKGPASAQSATAPPGMALHDWTAELHDFADTAALIANLDLVISVDTAVVHLAAALGKPTWLLNRFDTCWRWMVGRDDSPWYPTLRQFRQPVPGDWTTPIDAAARELAIFSAQKNNHR